jgi:glycosyltransferase involved in cell wall biosynthesis
MLLKKYKNVDGILFLSKEESYGFPLIEAMYLDLPIICPNLSFARVLCGDEAIYFDPNDIYSLKSQIFLLRDKLQNGWEPNWKNQMEKIPHDWEAVANEITSICS